MRIVRIDQIAPGGAALELHPQLMVLRDAAPELRRRLEATVRALGGVGDIAEVGVIEVSGVQLALDRATLARLRLEPPVDPVVRLAPPGAARPAHELPPPVVVVSSDEADLREQLRGVTSTRTELGARMDGARSGLDPFSSAALEVCLGQIDALEARRATLRVDWEREQGERDARLAEASAQLAALRSLADRVGELERVGRNLQRAIDQRADVVANSGVPDLGAGQLAAQLDAAAERARELWERRDRDRAVAEQLRDALAAERERAAEIQRAATVTPVDRSAVQRLEAVRDEIFAVDGRQSVLGAARNKRRVAELRSEEAILLDRLGFDTYSSYVMGIPSVRAELERAAEVTQAKERVAAIESRMAQVEQAVPDRATLVDAAAQLHRLLGESRQLLGEPADVLAPEQLALDVAQGGEAAVLVRRTAESLRGRTLADPAAVELASMTLHEALEDAVRALPDELPDVSTGPLAVATLPAPPAPDRNDVDSWASRWLDWLEAARGWSRGTEAAVVELERIVADLGNGPDPDRIGRWAQVEAELDEALDRLADAQERVRGHETATAELAALRAEELALRDQERELLARIAAADAAVVPPPVPPTAPPPAPPATPAAADALEWELIARLSRQRSVSFVGSVPILIDGLPEDVEARDRVLARLERMSDLVQVVLLAEGDVVSAWAAGLAQRGQGRSA